jgi:rhodanese-related sulfurtransferase
VPQSVNRRAVIALRDGGAQLVEVLPRAEYEEEHLVGAVHLPLTSLTRPSAGVLDMTRPVIVYCHDGL